MAVFCELEPYSLVDIDRRSRRAYFLHHQGDLCSDPNTLCAFLTEKKLSSVKYIHIFSYTKFLPGINVKNRLT
jgi:hypothetical protein